MAKEEMKTYLIKFENGTEQKITVPEEWKVTFGPASKGEKSRSGPSYKMPLVLRFYKSDTKQRAIFTDVISFRDTSIKIEEKKIRVQEKDGYMECEGARERTTFRAQTTEWINPDEPSDPSLLPGDAEMFDNE